MQFLNESSSVWSDFNLKAEVVTCFIKHNDTILLLKNRDPVDAPLLWGVPGGKV
jgi:ADP-ribose pyrophosphatase YjhB (NUDIX family)